MSTPPDKSESIVPPMIVVFVVTLVCYLTFFYLVENRRVAQSPWQVSFEPDSSGNVHLVVEQQSLKLGPVEIVLPGAATNSFVKTNLEFATPRPVPRQAPVGEIQFEDLTFLPGTVAIRIYGTDIQMLPRTLTVGTNEIPWASARVVEAASNRLIRVEK